ncbi:MAG: serine/threonine protein kinase [Proteobacteria bacterium]|nr:serine/threonine protein kinase [Pseudomonadota bacterium]
MRAPNGGQHDLTIAFSDSAGLSATAVSQAPLYTSAGNTKNGEFFLTVWRNADGLYLQHANENGRSRFAIDALGHNVRVVYTSGTPMIDIAAYLLGPVLGCVLRLRGITCLHCGVMAVGKAAIAVIGPKGAGKSTIIAYFAQRGHPILTDDIAPLEEKRSSFLVQPGYPCLRLWPDIIEALGDVDINGLSKVLSIIDKRFVVLNREGNPSKWSFQPKPLPLAAIYFLDTPSEGNLLSIDSVSQATGLIGLVKNTYADYLLDVGGRRRDFGILGQLAGKVPLRRLRPSGNLEDLPQIYDAMLDDFHSQVKGFEST